MSNNLDRLLDGVTDNPVLHASIMRLLANISAQAEAAANQNPEAATALGDLLRTHGDHIASHVLANTPMISVTATPPVHPEPEDPDADPADPDADPTEQQTDTEQQAGQQHGAGLTAETQPAAQPDTRTKRQIAADERKAAHDAGDLQ